MRKIEDNKEPHITVWKKWIMLIIFVQLLGAIQSYRIHCQMQEKIYHTQDLLKQVLQNEADHQQKVNQMLQDKVEYQQKANYIHKLIIHKIQEEEG